MPVAVAVNVGVTVEAPIFRLALAACIKIPEPANVVITVKPPEAIILLVVPVVLFTVKLEKVVAFPFIDDVAAEKV